MKKRSKLTALMLTLAMLCTLLSGCVYENIDIVVHDDGSGTIAMKAGLSEELFEDADEETKAELAQLERFEVDGKVYYGTTDNAAFDSVESFNEAFRTIYTEGAEALDAGEDLQSVVTLVRDGGGLTLVLDNRYMLDETEDEDLPDGDSEEIEEDDFYEADDAEIAQRAEDILALCKKNASGFTDAQLKEIAEDMAESTRYSSPAEFEEALGELKALSKDELNESLRYNLEWLEWEGLDDATRKAREKDVAAALRASKVELTDEQVQQYAAWFVDFYDDPDVAFRGEMEAYLGDEDSLRSELEFLDSYYTEEDPFPSGGEDPFGGEDPYGELEDAFTMNITVRFDSPVTQIAGPADGVAIEGGALTLDLLSLTAEVYRFTTRTDVPLALGRTQIVELDGEPVELSCYALRDANGGETNYVRVRDLASLLDGTKAQFNVDWNGSVVLTPNTAYTSRAAETVPFSGSRTYSRNASKTLVGGKDAVLDSILLTDEDGGGYTYYKLRDLGAALGFNVRWDGARSMICIESDKPYTG